MVGIYIWILLRILTLSLSLFNRFFQLSMIVCSAILGFILYSPGFFSGDTIALVGLMYFFVYFFLHVCADRFVLKKFRLTGAGRYFSGGIINFTLKMVLFFCVWLTIVLKFDNFGVDGSIIFSVVSSSIASAVMGSLRATRIKA